MKKIVLFVSVSLFAFGSSFSQNWERYKSEKFAFIVNFPSEPTESVQKVSTAIGELDMNMFMYQPTTLADDNAVYSVIRSEYPEEQFKDATDESNDNILDGAVNGAVNNVNGTLLYDKKTKHNGYPGRSIKIQISAGYLYINAYLVNNMMYITQVICLIDKDGNDSISRFLNSFDILKVK
ncbi:hypothetical protein [Winogradskyella haliclonae]|uniref:Uncharacterized protein n=1 Tax=Winogradskyella haliclonae TaxID=2048558 RepID=A0ABQ2C0A8_9FLAO|nr:hypothetical protein [Winogradskyella haliclonae]GGI57517.1 hypothetical protein GCM10011444_18260 [Winogradskyella haliclonae]